MNGEEYKNKDKTSAAGFRETSAAEWDHRVAEDPQSNFLMSSRWGEKIIQELPFVGYRYFRYGNTHLVRFALINERYTTAPFSDGSDVIVLDKTSLDLSKFQIDLRARFGDAVRLRVGERFAPVVEENGAVLAAREYVVDLHEPLLPRVRKTLRHILSHVPEGTIEATDKPEDIAAAYELYLCHMRSVRNFALPRKLFEALSGNDGAQLWVWRKEGRVRAAALFLSSGDEALYSLSAADQRAFAEHVPHHLVYTALASCRERGIMRASLGATGVSSSLEVFKRGWRGDEYRIFEIGARRLGVQRTSSVRALAGFVPLSLYPLLTKQVAKYLL